MAIAQKKGISHSFIRPNVNEKNRMRWRRWFAWAKASKICFTPNQFFWDLDKMIREEKDYLNENQEVWYFVFENTLDLDTFKYKYDSEEFDDLIGPDTEDWHLAARLEWIPKKKPYLINCPYCGGRGETGGGFGSFDPPDTCQDCFGSGRSTHPGPDTEKPKLPEDLIEHLRKVWREYYNEKKEN